MPTRISGACNACRSKKQKCSGDKSGCAQCEAAGIACTWPEQRKRGPAKGYIEGLEHRLHDAESLLLQLLPHVSTEQLQSATSILANNQENNESGRESPDHRSSPPILNKKTGIEYWENFPLTSVAGIRRWQQDCEIHGGTSHPSNSSSVKTEIRGSSPASHLLPTEDTRPKRRSLPNAITSSASFAGSDASIDELFNMHTNGNGRRSSAQVMQQQQHRASVGPEQIHMGMAQPSNPWQSQMMSLDHPAAAHNNITQQQLFTHVGYLNASAGWPGQGQPQQGPAQQSMQMDIDQHQHPVQRHSSSQMNVHVPAITSQTHSHLFW